MARAHFGTGFFLVVGLVAGAATAAAQAQGSRTAAPTPPARAANPHAALNDAIEAQRRGDYENAALLLQGAAAGQALLTTTEQQELTRLLKDNGAALDARRAASEQLRLAGNAVREKRQADAVELLKKVAVNEQYLNAADRKAFRQCSTGLLPGVAAAPVADIAGQARGLVRQAHAYLIQGDFDRADQEAREAVALKAEFARNEDSPAKVIEDLAKAHTDPTALLKASRAALARKDYDRAERYAHESDKASPGWAVTLFGDTPSKALKDIEVARAASPTAGAARPCTAEASQPAVVQASANANAWPPIAQASNPPPAASGKDGKNTEQARALLAQARKAMDAGDPVKAAPASSTRPAPSSRTYSGSRTTRTSSRRNSPEPMRGSSPPRPSRTRK